MCFSQQKVLTRLNLPLRTGLSRGKGAVNKRFLAIIFVSSGHCWIPKDFKEREEKETDPDTDEGSWKVFQANLDT